MELIRRSPTRLDVSDEGVENVLQNLCPLSGQRSERQIVDSRQIGPNSRNRSRPLAVKEKIMLRRSALLGDLGDNAFLDELADLVGDELA